MHPSTHQHEQRTAAPFTDLEAIRLRPTASPLAGEVPEHVIRRDDYTVRVARSSAQRLAAAGLVERMYASRGYVSGKSALVTRERHRITLVASNQRELFGTLTLGLDSANGLLAERLYDDEIAPFRRAGRGVCELSKFAVDPDHSSKEVLASIIQLAYVYLRRVHKASDAFIEVNPRHAPFYKRMIGFRQIGELKTCPRVNAPAVLLHLEFAYMDEQVRKHAGSRDGRERSLYPYFLRDCDWNDGERSMPQVAPLAACA